MPRVGLGGSEALCVVQTALVTRCLRMQFAHSDKQLNHSTVGAWLKTWSGANWVQRAMFETLKTRAGGDCFRIAKFLKRVIFASRTAKLSFAVGAAGSEFRTLVSARCDAIELRMRGWDLALDRGPKGLRNLVRVITFPPHALSTCPCARRRTFQETLSFLTFLPLTQEVLVIVTNSYHYLSFSDSDSVLFNYLCSLANLF